MLMKFFKYIFAVFLFVIVSGCTSSYNLIIDDNKFTESISFSLDNNTYKLFPFDNNNSEFKSYPFYNNNDILYDTVVTDIDNGKDITLSHEYTSEEFKTSNALNLCFDNYSYKFDNDYYYFNVDGEFKCLYQNESVDINIITKYKVIENNADSVNGDVYTWHIDNSNKDYVSIKFKIDKNYSFNYIVIILFVFILISSSFIVYTTYKKRTNNRNEI